MLYADLHGASLRHCATHDSVGQRPQSLGKLSTSSLGESLRRYSVYGEHMLSAYNGSVSR